MAREESEYVLRGKVETEFPIVIGMMWFVSETGGQIDKKLAAKLMEQAAEIHDLAKSFLEATYREDEAS